MKTGFLAYVEVAVLRAGPGLLNLGSMLVLASVLGEGSYGFVSTAIVTAGVLANLLFGPVTFSIVSQHAKLSRDDDSLAYESSIMSLALAVGTLIVGIGALGVWMQVSWGGMVVAAAAFGVFQIAQEALRARVRLWAYGTAALTQAGAYLLAILLMDRSAFTTLAVLLIYSASYILGLAVSLLFLRQPRRLLPRWSLLRSSFKVGSQYTLSKVVENVLNVGFRYLLVWFGSPQQLSVFSFCLDISQRLIGFIVNVFRFRAVPAAFIVDARGSPDGFRVQLHRGLLPTVCAAAASCIVVVVVSMMEVVTPFSGGVFAPAVFALLSAGVIVNQVKKTVFDPFAMRADRTAVIGAGYAAGFVVAIPLALGAIFADVELLFEAAFLVGMVGTLVASRRMLRGVA